MENVADTRPILTTSRKGTRFVNKSCRQRGANSNATSARKTTAVHVSNATASFRLAGDGRLELGERSTSKYVENWTRSWYKYRKTSSQEILPGMVANMFGIVLPIQKGR